VFFNRTSCILAILRCLLFAVEKKRIDSLETTICINDRDAAPSYRAHASVLGEVLSVKFHPAVANTHGTVTALLMDDKQSCCKVFHTHIRVNDRKLCTSEGGISQKTALIFQV